MFCAALVVMSVVSGEEEGGGDDLRRETVERGEVSERETSGCRGVGEQVEGALPLGYICCDDDACV